MPIQDFELYHGALLTKLVRSDRPITIRMIETDTNEYWSAYTIDGAVTIYTKASGHGDFCKIDKSVKWTFTFQPRHLDDLQRLSEENDVYLALICANHRLPRRGPIPLDGYRKAWEEWLALETALRRKRTGICFLKPDEWRGCLELVVDQTQSIKVVLAKGRSFLVNDRLRVPRNRLDKWEVGNTGKSDRLVLSQT